MLTIFEARGTRFAVHFEVKQPKDKFGDKQAEAYPLRAACWVRQAPDSVLPHSDADTALLCSSTKLADYSEHLEHFGAIITFEEIAQHFPTWNEQ
ncbi:MAG: hypothetical protein JO256_15505 [Alphaproteobacteria bacterium]|nr:hypothetical protein [Alphaproteobacteria bacterium]